jgi:lauroyl/myristoyl acyltransferase
MRRDCSRAADSLCTARTRLDLFAEPGTQLGISDVRDRAGLKTVDDSLRVSLQRFLDRESQNSGPPFCLIERLRRWGAGPEFKAAIGGRTPRGQVQALAELGRQAFDADLVGCRTEAHRNLEQVVNLGGARTLRERVRAHCVFLFVSLLDPLVLSDDTSRTEALRRVELHGQEHADAALAAGRGAIFLGCHQAHSGFGLRHPHFANWRFTVVRNPSDTAVYPPDWVERSYGPDVDIVPATTAGAARLRDCLAVGGFAALHADFSYPQTVGVPGSLFGRPVLISRSLIRLILRSRVPVLPSSVVRLEPFESRRIRMEIFPPLPLDDLTDSRPGQLRAAMRLSVATECLIRRHPVQWTHWTLLDYRWQQAAVACGQVRRFAGGHREVEFDATRDGFIRAESAGRSD